MNNFLVLLLFSLYIVGLCIAGYGILRGMAAIGSWFFKLGKPTYYSQCRPCNIQHKGAYIYCSNCGGTMIQAYVTDKEASKLQAEIAKMPIPPIPRDDGQWSRTSPAMWSKIRGK